MNTIREIATADQVWSLEEMDGEYYLMHAFGDADDPGPRACIPMMPEVLEAMALAIQAPVPIHDKRQNVIAFRPKLVPGSPVTQRIA